MKPDTSHVQQVPKPPAPEHEVEPGKVPQPDIPCRSLPKTRAIRHCRLFQIPSERTPFEANAMAGVTEKPQSRDGGETVEGRNLCLPELRGSSEQPIFKFGVKCIKRRW
jgi:hypothetical protein